MSCPAAAAGHQGGDFADRWRLRSRPAVRMDGTCQEISFAQALGQAEHPRAGGDHGSVYQGQRRLAPTRRLSCKVVAESSGILIGAGPVGPHGRAEPPATLRDLDSLAPDSVRICGPTDAPAFLARLVPSRSAHRRRMELLSNAGQARDWLASDRLRDRSGLTAGFSLSGWARNSAGPWPWTRSTS